MVESLSTCLWFDGSAEEAAVFYTSLLPASRLGKISRWGEGGPGQPGEVMSAVLTILGQEFLFLNGGPHFKLSPAVSFTIQCDSQEELDQLWETLKQGGETMQCGWLTDRFGVTWQIIPASFVRNLETGTAEQTARMMAAMMTMVKLDQAALEAAFQG